MLSGKYYIVCISIIKSLEKLQLFNQVIAMWVFIDENKLLMIKESKLLISICL